MIRNTTVQIRTTKQNGYWKPLQMRVDYKNPKCEFCAKKLFVKERFIYCDTWADDHDKVAAAVAV